MNKEHPEEEVIARLFQVADDDECNMLEQLAIKAGFRKKCPDCGYVTIITDVKCESCGTALTEATTEEEKRDA